MRLHRATVELSRAHTSGDLARAAAALAIDVLGFDRVGIWVFDLDANTSHGTFGTDERGALRDERDRSGAIPHELVEQLRAADRWWVRSDSTELRNDRGETIGRGCNAAAAIRDGETVTGVVHVDNLLGGRPLGDAECDLLALYASFLGPLYARCRAEEAVRASADATSLFQDRLIGLHRATMLLSACTTIDGLCRMCVEHGREHLGFRRMGLWFLDAENDDLIGSYGIDYDGRLSDERSMRVKYGPWGDLHRAEREMCPWILHPDRPMRDERDNLVGSAAIVEAPVWDGERVIGCIYADNYIDGPPLSDRDCEVAALYAGAIGHLIARLRSEEALHTSVAEQNEFQERLLALHVLTTELSTCNSLDELFRMAIELGHERLGCRRLGLWMLDPDTDDQIGTFGIDEEGRLRDERGVRFPTPEDSRLTKARRTGFRWDLKRDAVLRDANANVIGHGPLACVPVWDGTRVIGALFADNLGGDTELDERDCEVLALFASSLGHLAARLRAEEERAALEIRLQHAQKMESVGRLAGGVAHDFNNLLTSLLGNVSFALEVIPEPHPARTYLCDIQRAGEAAGELTRQLLAFSRKQVIDPRVFDLNSVVSGLRSMLRRLIGEDVDLRFGLEDGIGSVRMDPGQLEQVLVNLAVNSRDAMPAGGVLHIATGRVKIEDEVGAAYGEGAPGHYLTLSVRDTGIGMDSHALSHVFEPFFTTKEQGKGTGLGLATVYGIVTQNQGFVTVHSQPGHGSTFCVHLPRAAEALTPSPVKHAAPAPRRGGTETILLVEDEPMVRELAGAGLRRLGYTVLDCPGPLEAIRTIEANVAIVHLLLTDVIMPEMNGRDLSAHVKRLRPDVRVLFMSGYAEDVVAHSGVLEEEVNFIGKPFRIWQLGAKVREVLDG